MSSPIVSFFQRLGCIATFLFALALFFAFGSLVTLFNGDFWSLLQSLFLTALCVAGAIYLARRRHQSGEKAKAKA